MVYGRTVLKVEDSHRTQFNAATVTDAGSRANAYKGSVLIGTASVLGGVVQEAIVQVKFSKAHPDADLDMSTEPSLLKSKGGIVKATCTGMIKDSGRHVTVVYDGVLDQKLHDNISVPYGGSGDLETFIVEGRIGRTVDADILGPDGQENNLGTGGETWDVGYEMSGSAYADWNARQSPPTSIEYPAFEMSPPSGTSPVPSTPGNAFTCEGGVHTTGTPGGTQNVQLRVIDNDLWPNPNDLLVDVTFPQSIPAASFSGALIPCSHDVNLFKDSGGHVAGADGSSDESSAQVFQELPDIGEHSGTVTITVTP